MKIKNEIRKVCGTASTLDAKSFLPEYAERVEKFLTDNSQLGDKWMQDTASKLYVLNRNKDDEVVGSNPYVAGFISTYCPEIPLITGIDLKSLVKNTGNLTPFGPVYIDFGVQTNGNPKTNGIQAKILQEDYKCRKINNKDILVPNYNQLTLVPSQDAGLAFRLKEDILQKDLIPISAYGIRDNWTGKNGFFGAYLGVVGDWYADVGVLSNSYGNGRVIRYDAEGVESQNFKILQKEKNLATKLKNNFLENLA